jgi:predicted metal-dependent phosphoesterase TrpH
LQPDDRPPRTEATLRKPSVRGRHARTPDDRPGAVIPPAPSTVDLHTHTTRSDGVLEPADLVRDVAATGVRLLAITDHDTLAAYREVTVSPRAVPNGLELIAGVEINALARDIPLIEGELHILGFGMDPGNEAFEATLAVQRAARRVRFERTIQRLRDIGLPIDSQVAAIDLARDDALGRPTIARALIAAGFAQSVEDAFRRLIGWGSPAYVPREGLGPYEAIAAIRASGGVAVLAHFSEAPEQVALLRELAQAGLRGLEVYYRTFDEATVASVLAVARGLRFVATGGSDYHGDLMTYAEAHTTLHVPSSAADEIRAAIVE